MKFEVYDLNVISAAWGDDPDDFFVQAHCEVRSPGEHGGEAFSAYIVSPKALQGEMSATEGFSFEYGRRFLIVSDFDKTAILEALQRLVEASRASTWSDLVFYIERYFDWL